MDHCEFPYGAPDSAGILGLGSLGWILAVIELLIILALFARGGSGRDGERRGKPQDNDALAWKYATVLLFAEAAAKSELANIYKARDNLLRAIEQLLGRDKLLGADLAAHVAKLRKAGDAAKPPAPPKPASHHDGAAHVAPAPQVTVNINTEAHDAHGGGHAPHTPGEAKPDRSLDERLGDVRAAAIGFADYWKDRSARLADLQAMRDNLTKRGSLDSDLEKLRAGTGGTSKSARGDGGGASNHRALQTG